MDMKYLIGLDIGTSAVKGVLMREDGNVLATEGEAFKYTLLDNGGVEIEADCFINSCFTAIKKLSDFYFMNYR